MANKILGLDLGTNSLGVALRNPDLGENIVDQLEYYTSIIFKSGVGVNQSGEYSYAAERTKFRSTRRLYQARKYRLWSTLELLISQGYCPLSIKDLDRWRCYDKAKGLKRQYPVDAIGFEQWIKLDFDGDGKPDYSSPYQLRDELMNRQFDFSQQIERFKLGRALYHIAQHRGFKSSKGETLKEQESNEIATENIDFDFSAELKKSEEKASRNITQVMNDNNLQTVGCAMYYLEKNGIRVRGGEYTAVRSQYKQEIVKIFEFQKDLSTDSDFYHRLISEKKGQGTIFYRRPLRSQRGNVGKCTMEPNKHRCPTSHPEFEEFRAWSFINNIKYRVSVEDEWQALPIDTKKELFEDKFLLTHSYFKFEDIRLWLSKKLNINLQYERNCRTINYPDRTTVSGCPVLKRIINILGPEWRTQTIKTNIQRINKATGEVHTITYNYEDLWHIAYNAEDPLDLKEFAEKKATLNEVQTNEMLKMFNAISQGYAMLSLKAIRNINPLLRQGLIYSDAVLLAKIPEIIGAEQWSALKDQLLADIAKINAENRLQRRLLNIVNNLISQYKSQSFDKQFAYKDTQYQLMQEDYTHIDQCIAESYHKKEWQSLPETEQASIRTFVADHYQAFFASSKRDYYSLPKISTAIQNYLNTKLKSQSYDWTKLYHPSQIELYAHVNPSIVEVDDKKMCVRLLKSPSLGSIKNPMALRTMNILRRQINEMLRKGLIDEDTRIVVETARELNDANMRWAINHYQEQRRTANEKIRKLLEEFDPAHCSDEDVRKARLLFEQNEGKQETTKKAKKDTAPITFSKAYNEDIVKYKLWKEQGCRCLYTGQTISLSRLLSTDNQIDIEHTIPRSISFDDSLSNLTICDPYFNRHIKQNRIPSELDNYSEILQRIDPWIKKVEHLKDQVEQWRTRAKQAATKDRKDFCIRQMHVWRMELDYWQAKVRTFTIKRDELDSGFRNSQLVDTRIVTKYAFHFLKSCFNHVEVQKGEVTAIFRKILAIQNKDEVKDRSRHSHHAIDATVLTLIPRADMRDKMIKLHFAINDTHFNDTDVNQANQAKTELKKLVMQCRIGVVGNMVNTIEQQLFANLITLDRTLEPAKKKLRQNGKIVKGKSQKGDSIRCSLHKDTFYGAIKFPQVDNNGYPIAINGEWQYKKDKNGNDEINLVVRIPIDSFEKEKDTECIVNPEVRKAVLSHIQKVKAGERDAKSPIYLFDKNGNEKTIDKNGHPILPIRHVRCFAKAGRGYLGYDTALHIKQQTYLSDKEYKQSYHVQNDDNYLFLLYEGVKKGIVDRTSRIVNYFDIAQLGIKDVNRLHNEPYFNCIEKKGVKYTLSSIIKKGQRVLFWEKTPTELYDLDRQQLLERMFVVYKFNTTSSDHIYLNHHCFAGNTNIPIKEFTAFDSKEKAQLLQVTPNNFNVLIEHRDFKIDTLGNIIFND